MPIWGYGDAIPMTPLGKICGGVVALLGIGVFALPAGILTSGFEEETLRCGNIELECPHCHNSVVLNEDSSLTLEKQKEN